MDFTIRAVRSDEHTALGELTARAYLHDGLLDFGESDEQLSLLRDVAARAAGARVLVAADSDGEGRLLGGVTLAPHGGPWAERARPGEAELRMLAVAAGARRRGVGEALVRACAEHAAGFTGAARPARTTPPASTARTALPAHLARTTPPARPAHRTGAAHPARTAGATHTPGSGHAAPATDPVTAAAASAGAPGEAVPGGPAEVSRLVVSTRSAMRPARRLWARLGFVRTPDRDWEPLPGVTLLTYALTL
nr:GNAT family N-acetyltransferase [Streptomyces sp. LP05-1]